MFKPTNVAQLSPYLTVINAKASIEFYRDAFGFVLEEAVQDEEGNLQHVSMRKQALASGEGGIDFKFMVV